MEKNYSILIIDDHPLISDAYKNALKKINLSDSEFKIKIDIVENCDNAILKINEASKNEGIDLIFLDISLPPSKDKTILSGEDLGVKIKQLLPNSKIIISTTFNDNYRILNLFKNVNPEGFLIKNDLTSQELITAINTVINDPPYYSKSILKLLRKQNSNEYILDKIDRQLLHELSIGTKMKELPNILPLSISGIEKRKRRLIDIFEVINNDDRTLILMAKDKGFI